MNNLDDLIETRLSKKNLMQKIRLMKKVGVEFKKSGAHSWQGSKDGVLALSAVGSPMGYLVKIQKKYSQVNKNALQGIK